MSNRTCTFTGCGLPHDSHGYCSSHAKQLRKGQELHPLKPSWNGAECTAETECHEPIVARGYCNRHWRAWRKHGDPLVNLVSGREGSRRYNLNESYFDEIATEAQAYWLGFIAADGGVIKNSKTFALRVELAERDGGHVQRLADALGSDKPLWSRRSFVGCSFDSWRLVESLAKVGITPRKSATVEPWDGPADLMPHYWRGLFDGDGTIFESGNRSGWTLGICGSRACVEGFAAWAKEITASKALPARVRQTECWRWLLTGGRKPQLLAEVLYGNATVALERKRQRAEILRSVDYEAREREQNERRSAAMRRAWRDGTHPRSKAAA